jgi:hypothetical protein
MGYLNYQTKQGVPGHFGLCSPKSGYAALLSVKSPYTMTKKRPPPHTLHPYHKAVQQNCTAQAVNIGSKATRNAEAVFMIFPRLRFSPQNQK